jgi:hypothetical protein
LEEKGETINPTEELNEKRRADDEAIFADGVLSEMAREPGKNNVVHG